MTASATSLVPPSGPEVSMIHQILIRKDGTIPAHLPPDIEHSREAVRALYPHARYQLWDGNSLRQLIADQMPSAILNAFDTLTPMAYQADLARYVLLHVFGGLYVDLGVIMQARWDIPAHRRIAACRDAAFISPSWTAMQNGLIWAAEPGRPEFRHAMEAICQNCKSHYYGTNPLYPTGPVLLGKAFARALLKSGTDIVPGPQDIGRCICLTPEAPMHNLAYVSCQGTLIAYRTKKLPGDMSHMGVTGSNNYNQLWNARRVYGEGRSDGVIQTWPASTAPLRPLGEASQGRDGITVSIPMKGRMNTGPHATLPAGLYSLEVLLAPDTAFSCLTLEIACGADNRTIHRKRRFFWQKTAGNRLVFPFRLPALTENLEFRLRINRTFRGTLKAFRLISPRIRA